MTIQWHLKKDDKRNKSDSFFIMLGSHITFLEEKAKRKLKILELEGVIRPDYISPEELVDEVVILAWENFSIRPADKSIEHWLICLLNDHLPTIIRQSSPFVSLDEEFKIHNINSITEQYWMPEVMEGYDRLTLADLIHANKKTEAWWKISADGKSLQINTVLKYL